MLQFMLKVIFSFFLGLIFRLRAAVLDWLSPTIKAALITEHIQEGMITDRKINNYSCFSMLMIADNIMCIRMLRMRCDGDNRADMGRF